MKKEIKIYREGKIIMTLPINKKDWTPWQRISYLEALANTRKHEAMDRAILDMIIGK